MQSQRISLQTTYPEFFVKGSLWELDLPLKKRIMKGYNFAVESEGCTKRVHMFSYEDEEIYWSFVAMVLCKERQYNSLYCRNMILIWVVKDVYEFDQPIMNVKGSLGLFNYPLDINNLPPAHKAEPKYPSVDGKVLHMPVATAFFNKVRANYDFILEMTDKLTDILCPNPKKAIAYDVDEIVFESEFGTKTYKLNGIKFVIQQNPETGEPLTYTNYDGESYTYYQVIFKVGEVI